MTTSKKLLVCAGKRQVWFLCRNGAIGWDEMVLVSGFALGIAGLGKPGQVKWNQAGNRKMEERGHSCRGQPRLMADNEQNET
jgi:hypothetical protein